MSRWIDADELTKEPWFVEIHGETIDDIAEQIIKACKYIVKSAPSIDIVRCKECKHWNDADEYCRWFSKSHTSADDYCSYGEREGE